MADDTTPKTETKPTAPAATSATSKKSNNKLIFIIIGAAVILLFIVPAILFWVAKATLFNEKNTTSVANGLIESATGGKVDIDTNKGEVTVKGDNGSEFSTKQSLPSDFPKDIPLYTPYDVTGSFKSSENGKTNWSVVTSTNDSYDKAKSGLASKYATWEKSGEYEINGTIMSNYENATYSVTVTLAQPTDSEKKTTITYIVTQQ